MSNIRYLGNINSLSNEDLRPVAGVGIIFHCSVNEPLRNIVLMPIDVGICRVKSSARVCCRDVLETAVGEGSFETINESLSRIIGY